MPTQQPTRAATAAALCVDEHVVAQQTGMSLGWIRKDRQTRRILPYYKLGGAVRYNLDRVRAALAALEEGGAALQQRGKRGKRGRAAA